MFRGQNTTMGDLAAIIPAGGGSRRMGFDKARAIAGGKPLLQRVGEVALAVADPVVAIAPRPQKYLDAVAPGCRLVAEAGLPGGPLPAIAQGMAEVEAAWVLVLACDLPCLTVAAVREWQEQLAAADPSCVAVLPRHPQGWWESLCGFYRGDCAAALAAEVARGQLSLQGWLARQAIAELAVADRTALLNCNTPADLARARQVLDRACDGE